MSRRSSPQDARISPCFWRRSRRSPASVHTRPEILEDLADSDDEDIVAAADEAMAMADGLSDNDEDEDEALDDEDEYPH
jgi:hypothetical protein